MEAENQDITEYNTAQFQYRTRCRRFSANSATLIICLLKTEPNRYWRVEEITKEILIADNQPNTPVNRAYIKNVHAAMNRLLKKGIVERQSDKAHKVALWQLKTEK
ncbi:DNA repair ATPase [[Pasteurella] mairii]|uniref:DNA repair ATPase n=1 Tax=[Pasteurella] mairii TaxID=757 RepID=A0A379B6U5_9PAST|nr:DNA repair ATPase [[Pasteurella] mairii]